MQIFFKLALPTLLEENETTKYAGPGVTPVGFSDVENYTFTVSSDTGYDNSSGDFQASGTNDRVGYIYVYFYLPKENEDFTFFEISTAADSAFRVNKYIVDAEGGSNFVDFLYVSTHEFEVENADSISVTDALLRAEVLLIFTDGEYVLVDGAVDVDIDDPTTNAEGSLSPEYKYIIVDRIHMRILHYLKFSRAESCG